MDTSNPPRRRLSRLVVVALTAHAATVGAQPGPLTGFDSYLARAMAEWKVPGLAIAVVAGDQVVLAKGYGVRALGRPESVDAETIFAIGSATKTFTATAIGMLADEGKLALDDPVRHHLPNFELADPIANQGVTIRDLLSHRTGVGGGDLLWASGGFDRNEIVRRIRFVPATWGFRSRFDYSNIMFIAAGEVVARVSGTTWDEFLRRRIFEPLEMNRTVSTVTVLPTMTNVATPHDPTDRAPIAVAWRNMDNTVAGGGINSSVADVAKWLRFQLRGGTVAAKRLLSTAHWREMQSPQTIIRREGSWESMTPDAHFMAYGLGWIISDYHGEKLLQHGGGIDGMSAMVGILPERDLGWVVLTNLNGNRLPAALMHRVVDAYLGRPTKDWSAWYLSEARRADSAGRAATAAAEARIVPGTKPTLAQASYAGTYRHPAWGDAVVTVENGTLRLRYGTQFDGSLEHVQHDAFRARWSNPARGTDYLNFTIDVTRRVSALDLYLWITAHFDRVDPPR